MARRSQAERRALYEGLREGIRTEWSGREPLFIRNQLWTMAELTGALQEMLDAMDAADRAYAVFSDKVAARRTLERTHAALVAGVVKFVQTELEGSARKLARFGQVQHEKTGPKTNEAKVRMVEKAKATRRRRGTMGKRQRRKIKG